MVYAGGIASLDDILAWIMMGLRPHANIGQTSRVLKLLECVTGAKTRRICRCRTIFDKVPGKEAQDARQGGPKNPEGRSELRHKKPRRRRSEEAGRGVEGGIESRG